ncbi:outer membrane protein assembly factor BamD [bacterium]|nr:outer membrane protein assembly factor BamD [candidate division CSSED10-310 bacterium]
MTNFEKLLGLLVLLSGLLSIYGCSRTIVLLSPADHYNLGNRFLEKEDYAKAQEHFQLIRDSYPTSEYATMSQFKLAQTQFARKHYLEAAVDFELFVEFHPAHKLAPEAYFFLALSKFKSMLTPDRDTTIAKEALIAYKKFLSIFPDHPRAQEAQKYLISVQDHLLTHELEVGMMYYRRKEYDASFNRLKPVSENAHDPELKAQAMYYVGLCLKHKKDNVEAAKAFESLVSELPDSKWTEKAISKIKHLKKK